ncbi:MAG: hypothetical protein ACRCZJ_07615 [Erysipelotrichaceae bacterium]
MKNIDEFIASLFRANIDDMGMDWAYDHCGACLNIQNGDARMENGHIK